MNSEESLPDFSRKAVTFYLAHMPFEYAVTLDSPIFELQAGRLFVVGSVIPSAAEDWSAGAHACVAWDQVSQYFVFDSASDFAERVGANPRGSFGFFGRG